MINEYGLANTADLTGTYVSIVERLPHPKTHKTGYSIIT